MSENDAIQEEIVKEDPNKILRNHVLGAMGVGLIPLPIVDLVALAGIQLDMLRRLAKTYEVPFNKDKGKNIIAALVGSTLPLSLGSTVMSLIKSVPLVGQTTGALAMPATAGAITYAIGKVFVQHFASGGTFLDLDPEKVKDYYAEKLKEGQKVASDLK